MKRLQTRAAAAALSALLLALPTCALAAETAPLTLSTQQNAAPVERRTDLGQLSAFGRSHTYMGVSVSDEWLYQARIGGLPLSSGRGHARAQILVVDKREDELRELV